MNNILRIEGGCYCSTLRYVSEGIPQASIQCHCRECQYITGGNPNVLMIMPLDGFKFVKGEPKTFKKDNITNPMIRLFCETCGTAIGTKNPNRPNSIILKIGTFDNPSIFRPEIAIFTCDKQNFHYISKNIKAFDKKP